MSSRRGPYRPRRTQGAAREVVDASGVRVAYLPTRGRYPARLDRLASVIAHALTMEELTEPTIRVIDKSALRSAQVWDGEHLLFSVDYSESDRDSALARCEAFMDGYVVARRMALGTGEKR